MPHFFDVFLSGKDANASVLVVADSEDEAVEAAYLRAERGEVCWEGPTPACFDVDCVEDLGEDAA